MKKRPCQDWCVNFFFINCLWDNKNVVFFQHKNVGKPTFFFLLKKVKKVKYKYIIQQNVVCLKKGEVIVWDKMYLMKCKSSKKLCKLLKIKQMYVNNF